MYNSIKSTLGYIVEKYEFNNLFLCNADKWYSYYEKVKNEDNYSYKINLLEEGLTTYIVSEDPMYANDPIIPISTKDLIKNIRNIIKTFKAINVISGKGTLKYNSMKYSINQGDSFIIPANLGKYTIDGDLEILISYIGEKNKDLVSLIYISI